MLKKVINVSSEEMNKEVKEDVVMKEETSKKVVKVDEVKKDTEDKALFNLDLNFYAESISNEDKHDFMLAVTHEYGWMMEKLTTSTIKGLNGKIENKRNAYTPEEVEGFKASLKKTEKELEDHKKLQKDTEEAYKKVLDALTATNENHSRNPEDACKTVLRVLASHADSKLEKYAITPAFQSPALYEALNTIHITSNACENGNLSMTKEVKAAYKAASDELESIIKNTFSLPVDTVYTSKTRVKIKAADKKLLNDCYVKGFKNNYTTDKNGVTGYESSTVNTLVKATKNKKTGKIDYDYSGLASTIARIVVKYYFA
jgi:hypothetical protein